MVEKGDEGPAIFEIGEMRCTGRMNALFLEPGQILRLRSGGLMIMSVGQVVARAMIAMALPQHRAVDIGQKPWQHLRESLLRYSRSLRLSICLANR